MKVLLFIILAGLLLGCAALIRTLIIPAVKSDYMPNPDKERALDYAKKLSRMVQYDTTSYAFAEQRETFLEYHKILEELFPLVHKHLEKTEIGGSLLYHWKGRSDRYPIVLMGHQAFFQAVEELLGEGVTPEQDIWLSTSCTEEWGGPGCPALVEELNRRGVKPWLVCDEGGGIYTNPMMGIKGNFAMIGVSEKGRANVMFTAKGKGGHASTPQKNSPIARIAAFVCDVEKHSPFKSEMEPETRAMLEALAPSASFPIRLVLENLWLFRRPIEWFTPMINGQAAAMLRTTITFTMASGSNACNVMPVEATLGANMRFTHHQDMEESLDAIRKVAGKYGLEMKVLQGASCTKMADIKGEVYRYVADTAGKTFPGCVSSPYVCTAATDEAFYVKICDNCIRFAPIIYGPEEKKGIHGVNEALRYDCLPGAVDFYKNLIMDHRKK